MRSICLKKINIVILLTVLAVMTSCSNNLIIKNNTTESKSINKKTIAKIKFDSQGYCNSSKAEEVILSELEILKHKLLDWDSKTVLSKTDMATMFKETVLNLNEFASLDNNNIQTDEREWIWSELEKIGNILGIQELDAYVDEWREW